MAQNAKAAVNPRARVRRGVFAILILLLASAAFDAPSYANRGIRFVNKTVALGIPEIPEKPFRLGLDLQGGTQLIYKADVSDIAMADRGEAVEGVRDVIDRRVNGLGVTEPNIQTAKVGDEYRIVVELPGVTDVQQAVALIGETPTLEFKEENAAPARALTDEEKKQLSVNNAAVKKRAEAALARALKGEDFAKLADAASDDAVSKANTGSLGFIGKRSPYPELYAWAGKAKIGQVASTLVEASDGYNVAKRGAERDGDPEVRARHILICWDGAERCADASRSKEQAKTKAEEIFQKANDKNFADLAREFSTDLGSKESGGDLGQFGKGAMVPPFEEAVFRARVGEIVRPVETQFGYHVIYKTGEERLKEYEVSRIFFRKKLESDIVPPEKDPWKSTGLSGKQLERAEVVINQQTGAAEVSLAFNKEGGDLFRDITTRNVGKAVAIFLDGSPISIPRVNQPILDGRAVIQGQFTLAEARQLSQRLNAGALPVPVELISEQSLGASLGAASLAQSIKAGVFGLLLVALFLTLYYRLPGLSASFALIIYICLNLAVFKLFGITMTLAGIAGFILAIGIACDANILIFERMKEELLAGRTLRTAIEEGFLRAWPSIRDSNITALITAAILLSFGSGFIKGFAVGLILGVLISMFSAITVTRMFLRLIAGWMPEYGNWMFLGVSGKNDTPTVS